MSLYQLTYSAEDGDMYETEWHDNLQHAIVNMLIVGETYPWGFTASIIYDNQDVDGQLHEVLEFSDDRGFEFDLHLLPL